MKLTNYFVILILSLAIVSCKNKREEEIEEDVAMRVIGEPQAVEDTVAVQQDTIENVEEIVDNVYAEETHENVVSTNSNISDNAPSDTYVASSMPAYSSSSGRVKDDNYDKSNSGFFDRFLEKYKEQGEKALQPTPSVPSNTASQASKFNQEKGAIEKSLDELEKKNQEVLETYERIERKRKEYNEKVLEGEGSKTKKKSKGTVQKSEGTVQKSTGGVVETFMY